MAEVKLLSQRFIDGFLAMINPVGDYLEDARVHPHVVTIAGLLFSIITGLLFWKGYFFWGGITFVLSGACDVLDGRLARNTERITRFGAIFDSTIDRYSEVAVFMGLAAFFDSPYVSAMIILAMAGSLLTSYVRARAEGLGIECKLGLMQRPERVTFIATGAILGALFDLVFGTHQVLLIIALFGVAVLANFTVVQRLVHVNRKFRIEKEDEWGK